MNSNKIKREQVDLPTKKADSNSHFHLPWLGLLLVWYLK